MNCKVFVGVVLGFVLLVGGCRKAANSYCNQQCVGCGRGRHTESKGEVLVVDEVFESDLSIWLDGYRSGECEHFWVGVSGYQSENNLAWHGESNWDSCLRYIKELSPSVGEAETRELLGQYYSMLEAGNAGDEDKESWMLRIDEEEHKKLEEFMEELKSRIEQSGAGTGLDAG